MATTPATSALPDDLAASLKALMAAQAPGASASAPAAPSMVGPDPLRPDLGRRTPPRYDPALAALQRAIY